MTQAVSTFLIDLPCTIRAYTVVNADMTYTIIINSHLSAEAQQIAFLHELQHINNGDFDKHCSANLIEMYAHREGGKEK